MELYAGIDLHSRNNYIGVINGKDGRVYSKRHGNRLPEVLSALKPFKRSLKGVVVESTYNWHWTVSDRSRWTPPGRMPETCWYRSGRSAAMRIGPVGRSSIAAIAQDWRQALRTSGNR